MGADMGILSTDVTEALQSYVERRLHFSLDRFGRGVGRVRVRISLTSMVPGEERISRARFPRNSSPRVGRSSAGRAQWEQKSEVGAEANLVSLLQSERIGGRDRDQTGDSLLAKLEQESNLSRCSGCA